MLCRGPKPQLLNQIVKYRFLPHGMQVNPPLYYANPFETPREVLRLEGEVLSGSGLTCRLTRVVYWGQTISASAASRCRPLPDTFCVVTRSHLEGLYAP